MPAEILPTYLGNTEIEETDRSDIAANVYGLDAFTANFQGEKTRYKVERFLKKLKANATHRDLVPDSPHSAFAVNTYNVSTDRSWATFTIQFVGKLDNTEPPPREEHSLGNHTITATLGGPVIGGGGGIEGDIIGSQVDLDYRSPSRTHTYVAKTRPDEPRYDVPGLFTGRIQVTGYRGPAALAFVTGRTSFIPDAFYLKQARVLKEFTREQAGKWWECEESYDVILMDQFVFASVGGTRTGI